VSETDRTAEAVERVKMLTAMARAHMNVRRAQGYAFDFDNLLPSEEGEYLAAMQAALEASALLAERHRLRAALEALTDDQCAFGQVWGGEKLRWMNVPHFARAALTTPEEDK